MSSLAAVHAEQAAAPLSLQESNPAMMPPPALRHTCAAASAFCAVKYSSHCCSSCANVSEPSVASTWTRGACGRDISNAMWRGAGRRRRSGGGGKRQRRWRSQGLLLLADCRAHAYGYVKQAWGQPGRAGRRSTKLSATGCLPRALTGRPSDALGDANAAMTACAAKVATLSRLLGTQS